MKLIQERLSEYAVLTGYLHEFDQELPNIRMFPVMLVLPGGGFRVCSQREGEPVAMAFYAEGYSAFVLDYTTVTKKPDASIEDPMADVQLALEWIRDHAGELLLASDRVAVTGFSGGGHLAAAACTHGPLRPNALVLGYPGILHSELRALECPDIVESVDEKTPPTFLFGSRDDVITPPAHLLAFADALDRAGVDYELHIFRSSAHGSSLGKAFTCAGDKSYVNPVFSQWLPLCVRWLTEKLGDFTIYGVNDGRFGRFSIDVPISAIMSEQKAESLVAEFCPEASAFKDYPATAGMTLRQLRSLLPGMTEEKLQEMDRRLLLLS